MPSATWIRIVILLAAATMFLASLLTGDSIDELGLRWLTGIIGLVTALIVLFDLRLWRLPGVWQLLELTTGFRKARGTWHGTLEYDKDENGNPGSQEIYLVVHQTFSQVSVNCFFPSRDSMSWSKIAKFETIDHRHLIRYLYQQEAPTTDRDVNRPTEGACTLDLIGRPVREIKGSYYSERGGKGKIELTRHSPRTAASSRQAKALKYQDLEHSN